MATAIHPIHAAHPTVQDLGATTSRPEPAPSGASAGGQGMLEELIDIVAGLGLVFVTFLAAIPGLLPVVVLVVLPGVILALPLLVLGAVGGAIYGLVRLVSRRL